MADHLGRRRPDSVVLFTVIGLGGVVQIGDGNFIPGTILAATGLAGSHGFPGPAVPAPGAGPADR